MANNLLIIILIIGFFVILIYWFIKLFKSHGFYVKSPLDNREYFVGEANDTRAAYILSEINDRIQKMRQYLCNNIDEYPQYKINIAYFCNRVKTLNLIENAHDKKYTSYTKDKGKEMGICLKSRNNGTFYDINLLTYVVLHELAHLACPKTDLNHTAEFRNIFTFLINIAMKIGIYHQRKL